MKRIFVSPSKVVIGAGESENLGQYIEPLGKQATIIASESSRRRMDGNTGFGNTGIRYVDFRGECTEAEVVRLVEILKKQKPDVIIGMGGGKALDTTKVVANEMGRPLIIMPTVVSTDAPCSSMAILYKESGETDRYVHLSRSPALVLIDSDIVAKAPTRYLISGMGDALATVFEVRACARAYADNMVGGKSMRMIMAIAEECFEVLMEDAVKARMANDAGAVTPALENIIEANTLMSGLGFESGGLAAAHAIQSGLNSILETDRYLHGEKVAFGLIVQLVLENADKDTLYSVLDFCVKLGLPVCLQDLNLSGISEMQCMKIGKVACGAKKTMKNMPFHVHPQDVASAIRTADMLGKTWAG